MGPAPLGNGFMTQTMPLPGATAALSPDIPARLQRWLSRHYGRRQAWHMDLIRNAGRSGRGRRILRLRNDDGQSIAIKSHDSRLRNRSEFHALRKLHEAAPDSIAPIYLARDFKYYAMEWLEAPLLSAALGRGDHAERITQAGAWLAGLHAHAAPRRFLETRLPNLQISGLDLSRFRSPRPGSEATRLASGRLRQRLRKAPLAKGPRAVLHGDFHAGNLFVLPDRVIGFDREDDGTGLTFLDSARFLVDLGQRRRDASATGETWGGDAEADRRLFFDAYGPLRAADLATYDAIEDALAFRVWRRQMRRGQSGMTAEIQARGLLGDDTPQRRPARLVARADGSVIWSDAPAQALTG